MQLYWINIFFRFSCNYKSLIEFSRLVVFVSFSSFFFNFLFFLLLSCFFLMLLLLLLLLLSCSRRHLLVVLSLRQLRLEVYPAFSG